MLNTLGETKEYNVADDIYCSFPFVKFLIYPTFYILTVNNISDIIWKEWSRNSTEREYKEQKKRKEINKMKEENK